MRVILLGPANPVIEDCIASHGDTLVRTTERLDACDSLLLEADFLVSYGYRFLIPTDVLRNFGGRAVNLHISLLPWNRGADPNLWSYLEDTPKGVTIHALDEGLDTGPILAQVVVQDAPGDTLATSYRRLSLRIEELFCDIWPLVRDGRLEAKAQHGDGSAHRATDKEPFEHLLVNGWDTLVAGLVAKALPKDSHAAS